GDGVVLARWRAVVPQTREAGLQGEHAGALFALAQRAAGRGGGLDPQAVAGPRQPLPWEQLARVFLAVWGDVGMADDARVGDGPTGADVKIGRASCRERG